MTALRIAALFLALSPALSRALDAPSDEPQRRYWIGSSMFVLANLAPGSEPPDFFQVNLGFRLTPRDSLSIEAVTWRYHRPLGIPWGSDQSGAGTAYPGSVRESGAGIAYQRFFWKGLYGSLSGLALRREFQDPGGTSLARGFQLFLTLRIGYHVRLMKRFFLEPSIAATAWPISTGAPAGFAVQDRRWPSWFLAEPGLHFGVEY